MKLRTYQSYTMAEALAAVKRDLGADAVILNTRTFKRGGMLGIGRRTIVEVTATPGRKGRIARAEGAKPPAAAGLRQTAAVRPVSAKAGAAQRAYAKSFSGASVGALGAVTDADRDRTRRLAQAMAEKFDREKAGRAEVEVKKVETGRVEKPEQTVDTECAKPQAADHSPAAATRRFILTPAEKDCDDHSSPSPTPPTRDPAAGPAMQEELAAIRQMVGQVLQRQTRSPSTATANAELMPARLFDMYLKLIAQDISEDLADRLLNDVREELSTEELDDEQIVRSAVLRRLAQYIPTCNDTIDAPMMKPDGRPMTIALVGPTGVGKTTTVAKLAATFKLRHRKRVGLITSDTYRIAAVDQLRTYANIIGLPLQVAMTPADMRQAVHVLGDCDVILIDTAGRGQNDAHRLAELREFIDAASPDEVHLVLSSTASEKVLVREAEAFSAVGVDKIVLTKLDEAVSFGMLVNVVRHVGKELSFITTGQEVPHHIEPGRAERLAGLVLGAEVHG